MNNYAPKDALSTVYEFTIQGRVFAVGVFFERVDPLTYQTALIEKVDGEWIARETYTPMWEQVKDGDVPTPEMMVKLSVGKFNIKLAELLGTNSDDPRPVDGPLHYERMVAWLFRNNIEVQDNKLVIV